MISSKRSLLHDTLNTEEGVAPDNAWGPPGGGDRNLKKRENLSVVKQTLPPKKGGIKKKLHKETPGNNFMTDQPGGS